MSDCPRWCNFREVAPHSGKHVHTLGELLLSEASPSYVLAVTIESTGDSPMPVVTLTGMYNIAFGSALLTWDEADRLAALLLDARKRYG